MKQSKSIRLLSWILALVMIFELVPSQGFAIGAAESADVSEGQGTEVYIQNELPELRSEYEKRYRQTDGSFVVTSFQVPIHYAEEGEWVDIQNTLEPVAMLDGTEVYQAINGDHIQAFASTLESGEIMTTGTEDTLISMSLWDGALYAEMEPELPLENVAAEAEPESSVSAAVPELDADAAEEVRSEEEVSSAEEAVPEETSVTEEVPAEETIAEEESPAEATAPEAAVAEEILPDVTAAEDESIQEDVPDAETPAAEPAPEESPETEPAEEEPIPEDLPETEVSEEETVPEDIPEGETVPEEEFPVGKEENSEEVNPEDETEPEDEEPVEEPLENPYAVYNRDAVALILDDEDVSLMGIWDEPEEEAQTVDAAIEEVNQRITSSVLYEDVYPGVDLRYDLHSYNVKESIILKEQVIGGTYVYGFLMNLDGLVPTMQDDGSISLLDSENVERYTLPAPFMVDSNESYSDAVTYTLTQQGDAWLLTVEADADWIEAPERVYPITIDPTIITTENNSYFVGCTATEKGYDHQDWHDLLDDELAVGYNPPGYCQMEMFIKITQVPKIPVGSTVINANVGLFLSDYMPRYESSAKSTLFIHEITEECQPGNNWFYGIKWEDRPSYSAPMDYVVTHGNQINTYLLWDVTRAAKKWYDDPASNYGLAFTSDQTSATSYRAYFDFEDEAVFTVSYRDTTGIEPYYTYETQSAVRAGTGYVGDYASTLTVAKNDFSFDNASMPFSFSHVFNSGLSGGELSSYQVDLGDNHEILDPGIFVPDYSAMKTGKGWQLSLQESVLRTKIKKADGTYGLYLVYRDGDGTSHYFTYDYEVTEYKDEDGLGLNIWLPERTTGTNDIYLLYDEQGNKKHFRNGYLVCIEDGNGNKVHLVYNGHTYVSGSDNWGLVDTGNRVTNLVLENKGKACIEICELKYTNSYLTSITDYAGRTTTYGYSSGRLTSITHPDGIKTTYTYDSSGNLIKMYDEEAKYGIAYSYSGGGVSEFKEYTVNGSTTSYGMQVSRTKNGIQDTVYRYSGNDGILNNSDDILNHYAFDNIGRTINITTLSADQTILGISSGAYVDATGRDECVNRIARSAQAGQASENLLPSSGLEKVDGQVNPTTKWSTNARGHIVYDERARTGTGSIKTTISSTDDANTYALKFQNVTLTAGKTYNFSCYVNTQDISDFNGGKIYMGFGDTGGNLLAGCDPVTEKTSAAIENGWHRVYATFTPLSTGTYRVYVVQYKARGSTYFDDLQLEEVWGSMSGTVNGVSLEADSAPSSVNLVQNGSFLNGNQEWSQGIQRIGSDASNNTEEIKHPAFAVISADANNMKRVSQTIPINAPATETFLLSGWGRADSTAECVDKLENPEDNEKRYYGLIAKCVYDGGGEENTEYFYMPFNDDYTGWQHSSCVIVPSAEHQNKTITSITVILAYDNNLNTANFTGISLRKEPCTTYTYDSEGNVIATTATGNDASDLEYEAGTSRITKSTTSANGTVDYQYDDANNENLVTDVINDGVGVHITYNANGNSTATTLGRYSESGDKWVQNNSGLKIKTSATFSADQTQLTSQTNANGYKTSYTYNASRQLFSTAQEFGPTVYTIYKSNSDRPDHTYISGLVSLHYTYNNGNLSSVKRGGYLPNDSTNKKEQTYFMNYDVWGNSTSVKVGSQNLASYTYAAKNGPLQSMQYGNGDSVEYLYDDLGRVTVEQHRSASGTVTATYQYFYNSEGVLAKKLDIGTNKAVNYEYDSLGRLIRSWETNGSTIEQKTEHIYDSANRLSSQTWVLGTDVYQAAYDYDPDNGALTYVDSVNGKYGDYWFMYDDLKRLHIRKNSRFDQTYTYHDIDDTQTTTQIEKIEYGAEYKGTDFHPFNLEYTYDNLGNISTVTGTGISGQNASYDYDPQGQLTSATVNGKSYTYEYDTYGNIRKAVENGTEHTYTYGNSNWLDLLTAYDNQTITYDAIGNPTSYYNGTRWAFSWKNGRQLASASDGTTTVAYTYDQDGIRDSKTVGTTVYKYITQNGKVVRQTWGSNTLDIVYDNSGLPFACLYNGKYYIYVLNLQGDVIRIVDTDGTTVAEYQYDAWGKVISKSGTMADVNPIRYRGYYYDTETGFYYLQSRYYDPEIGRFISADNVNLAGANGDFISYNLFAYCGSNPIIRCDSNGYAWETIWDIVSLAGSVAEVVANPADPWAWAGLIGDVIDVALPCVGGLGEAIDAAKTTVRVVQGADNIIDTARTFRRTADVADDIKKATGTYVILYENGMKYVGKGGFRRAIKSATEHMSDTDVVSSIIWAPTSNETSAFVAEYLLQSVFGVGETGKKTFNQIWSPGNKLFRLLQ